MSSSLLALSLSGSFTKIGAVAAFAALVGIAVLSLLLFSQARELKRLREWAGRAPERAADLEQRVTAAAAVRAQQQAPAVQAVRQAPRASPIPAGAAAAAAGPASRALPITCGEAKTHDRISGARHQPRQPAQEPERSAAQAASKGSAHLASKQRHRDRAVGRHRPAKVPQPGAGGRMGRHSSAPAGGSQFGRTRGGTQADSTMGASRHRYRHPSVRRRARVRP